MAEDASASERLLSPSETGNGSELASESGNEPRKRRNVLRDDRKSLISNILSQTFASTAHLANLLPTGTVLVFQILGPIFTNGGNCDWVSVLMTKCFLTLCALWCFFVSFTDSFLGSDGHLYYGIATLNGLKTFEYISPDIKIPNPDRFKLRFLDFLHAILSVSVFCAIAFLDKNIVRCLYPSPSYEAQEVLDVLPVAVAVVSSLIFTVFPTTRHGIGYPVTSSSGEDGQS